MTDNLRRETRISCPDREAKDIVARGEAPAMRRCNVQVHNGARQASKLCKWQHAGLSPERTTHLVVLPARSPLSYKLPSHIHCYTHPTRRQLPSREGAVFIHGAI